MSEAVQGVVVTRDGYLVSVVLGETSATARATSAPEARRAARLCAWWAELPSPAGSRWASARDLVEHVAREMDAADAAQARRRFRRVFRG